MIPSLKVWSEFSASRLFPTPTPTILTGNSGIASKQSSDGFHWVQLPACSSNHPNILHFDWEHTGCSILLDDIQSSLSGPQASSCQTKQQDSTGCCGRLIKFGMSSHSCLRQFPMMSGSQNTCPCHEEWTGKISWWFRIYLKSATRAAWRHPSRSKVNMTGFIRRYFFTANFGRTPVIGIHDPTSD